MESFGAAAGWLAQAAALLLLPYLLLRYFGEAGGRKTRWQARLLRPEKRARRGDMLRGACHVALAFLLSRALFALSGLVPQMLEGNLGEFPEWFGGRLLMWDARHYLGLIENWYVNEGDAMYHIVFFPLYPIVCRALYLIGVPAQAAAYAVSNLSYLGAGLALYALASGEEGHAFGARCVWLMYFLPASFFGSLVFTEGLFLCLTLLAVLCARRRRFAAAVALSALCALTRSPGLLTAVPVYWEMLRSARQRKGRLTAADAAKYALAVLPAACGTAAYVALNWEVTGDPFRFMTYQAEHWHQTFGSVANTVEYSIRYAAGPFDEGYSRYVFSPQLAAIFLALLLMWLCAKKLNAGDAAYMWLYFVFTVSPTWLLSGTRYLCAAYPVALCLGYLTKRKASFALAMALECAMAAYMGYGYLVAGSVM